MYSTGIEIARIRKITREQRYDVALVAATTLCAVTPSREALYLLAVNQRCLKQVIAALATLEKIERDYPPLGRLYQERGYCYLSLRDAPRAMSAFEQAVSVNPALKESLSALESLHRISGNLSEAASAAKQRAALEELPPEMLRALSLFADGDVSEAERLLENLLIRFPTSEAVRLQLADIMRPPSVPIRGW
jgi:Flp pilus assembly protein TadD